MKNLRIFLTLLLASFSSPLIAADPPGILTYQGRVSVSGVNFDSATAGHNGRFQFDLVDDGAATTYWTSSEIALPVVKGLYSVNLGDTDLWGGSSIPASAFQANNEVYLRVSFSHLASGALEVLSPDQRVTSVGYALKVQGLTLVDDNTAVGKNTLTNSTGTNNTATGAFALNGNTSGSSNTASGVSVLQKNSTGSGNTGSGHGALYNNTEGVSNTVSGSAAMQSNTTGSSNTVLGSAALQSNEIGDSNTAVGDGALINSTGSFNLALGRNAGTNLTSGEHNVLIAHGGVAAESNTIRVGDTDQTKTFVAGIRGVTTSVADAIPVMIDSTGQLGTVSSSRRYKEDIHALSEAASTTSDRLQQLRPVTFRYKQHEAEVETGEKPIQYGLIAEEVAEVFPELAVLNEDGQPETVKYHLLAPLLLNEVQKQRQALEQKDRRVEELEERLARLEAVLNIEH